MDDLAKIAKILGIPEDELREAHELGEKSGLFAPDGKLTAKGSEFALVAMVERPDWLADVRERVKRSKD